MISTRTTGKLRASTGGYVIGEQFDRAKPLTHGVMLVMTLTKEDYRVF